MDTIQRDTSLNFQFTRHGYSCNNAANMFSKEFEPSIHPFAIEQLDKEKNVKDDKHRFEGPDFDFETFNQPHSQSKGIHVFVSPLIRTWETALLLYSQENLDASGIDLYVSPYLKEHQPLGFKKGNFPQDPKIIMNKFLNFINMDRVKSLINNIETICIHWPQNINVSNIDSIKMKKIEFKRDSKTVGGVGEERHETIEGTVSIIIKPNFVISTKDVICDISNINNENKTYNDNIFLKEGNLADFMKYFNDLKLNYENHNNLVINNNQEQIVHVVTHSHIMKKYLKDEYKVDIKSSWIPFSSKFKKYEKANNWSFTDMIRTNPNEITKDNIIEKLKFKIGVPETHDSTIKYNDNEKTCGQEKIEIKCPSSGGKKTKKKRKPKRTHKKKNAHKKRKTHNKRKN